MNTIISESAYIEQEQNDRISKFFKKFNISKALKSSNFYKCKGTQPLCLLQYLFTLVFRNKNIYFDTKTNPQSGKSKNTVYRFLNSTVYDWCKLLYTVAVNVILSLIPLTSENRENVLIVDDTLYSRSRSKKVDMLTKVYDHNTGEYIKGFKLLSIAWSDGNTTVPLRFCPLVSTNKKMIINGLPNDMDKRTRAYKLRRAAMRNPVDAMLDLIGSIDLSLLKVRYVLFDSWFAFPSVIMSVCRQNVNVVCMLKRMYRVYYTFNGKKYNLQKLYETVPHSRKGEIIASVKVKIHNTDGEEQWVKILFVRSNRSNDWCALLSTDLNLSDEEMIRIYGKRWNIEVMFKISKHYLKLDSELESRHFESIYAHSAIVYLRYIMLAYENRVSEDFRTCGEIFFFICSELRDISFVEALSVLLNIVFEQVRSEKLCCPTQIKRLIGIFTASIPHCFCVLHGW